MPLSADTKRQTFRKLHEQGCFVLPNPWDAGSARLFEYLGFSALATTSSGLSWTLGKPDYAITLSLVLEHLAALAKSVELPINADFESGFAEDPAGVAENVRQAIGTGIAGLSVEDRDLERGGLYDKRTAVERFSAAKAAVRDSGKNIVLVARTEGLLIDPGAMTEAIDKLVGFAAAGADCLYAPGVRNKTDIITMVRAVAPKPVNLLVMDSTMTLAEIADLGIRRISVGGSLAKVGWSAVEVAAKQMLTGSFGALGAGTSGSDLNVVFGTA
jgi:2-methylisocitrate lyase-like PEP mutase family enzyme